MELRVRPAASEDRDEIVGLAVRAREAVVDERGGVRLLSQLGLPPDASDLSALLVGTGPHPGPMVWCASIDEVPVGFLVAECGGAEDARIVTVRELWVDPGARGVGAGEALMSAAIAWAIAEEATAIESYALPGARETKNLFERLGLTTRLLTVRRELG